MPTPLFTSPWFTHGAFGGIEAALHQGEAAALVKEGNFMSQLMLQLLDMQRKGELFNPGLYAFYAFCQPRLKQSMSQIYQDLWVLYMSKEKRDGFFVEFGACDGQSLSNTALLEKEYGWTGILAEPNPLWHKALSENRTSRISTKCVFTESGKRLKFESVPAMPELSRLTDVIPNDIHERNGNRGERETVEVETTSLLDLLREHDAPEIIDYLSIDTEGSELSILEAFDFDAYKFRLISVEHAGEKQKREKMFTLLNSKGYTRWRPELSRWDDWYWANW